MEKLRAIIKTYKDFLKSDCQMAILIVDCSDVAVYCKDRERTETLYRFCRERFSNAEYITDENDRSELYCLVIRSWMPALKEDGIQLFLTFEPRNLTPWLKPEGQTPWLI
ncbi:DUF2691 family protein [Bacillus infantis]|uniref:DUF2691 family protein n=1 Tax=Bacillus infantis TaxID=324767 RepID=UPI003CFA7DF6